MTINGRRELWYRLDDRASPKRLDIYNLIGGRRINIYACIYKLEGDQLIVCFQPGGLAAGQL